MKYFTLKNGLDMPVLGIGTDRINDELLIEIIHEAVTINKDKMTLIDTASVYGNHALIGSAISTLPREKIFLITKIFNGDFVDSMSTEDIINKYLADLGSDYIDIVLIHNPGVANYASVISDLIDIKRSGKIRAIGVSNFTVEHLESIEYFHDEIEINQIEAHPFLIQPELYSYCQERHILPMAYRPFCEGEILSNETMRIIGEKYNKSPYQIALKWNTVYRPTIFGSSSIQHLRNNMNIFDFELSQEEILSISLLNKNLRTCDGPWADFQNKKVQYSSIKTLSK